MKNDQHKTIVRLIYSFYSFEKIFFSLTVDYDVIDHVTLVWLEECSPRKNKSRLWTLQDSVERSLVPKFVRLLEKKPCLHVALSVGASHGILHYHLHCSCFISFRLVHSSSHSHLPYLVALILYRYSTLLSFSLSANPVSRN